MSDTAVQFRDVSFAYGKQKILDHFSLTIGKGDHVCLFGPSGCGKTTILRLICGLEKPTAGELFLYSKNLRPVFQEDRLLPFLTVAENTAMFANGAPIDDLLSELGLAEAKNERPASLSGGMARRASIARALAGDGDIYIFDEPFNGLDEANLEKAAALINEKTAGKTVVCVLHSRTDAERLGCRLIGLGK